MARSARQVRIMDLIAKKEFETQEELAAELQQEGFDVTQATISRDIKDLGLVKLSVGGKRQKYVRENSDRSISNKIINIFKHAVVSIDSAMNIVVVKTVSGNGNAAGMLTDRLENLDKLGCVAGDDTVLIVMRSQNSALEMVETLNEIMNQ